MKTTLTVIILFISLPIYAYTLNNNFGARFDSNKVKVSVAFDTTCSGVQLTPYELEDLIAPAVDDFWNRVPTSSLVLDSGGFTQDISNISTGRLCSPTDDDCITAAGGNLIREVDDIVIACNNNPDNFGGSNVLAVTIPNKFRGKSIKGAVILINDNSTQFRDLSREDKIGVISHEIGHAIGLGHSDDKSAMMYYRTVDMRRRLGQDDIDGLVYLYGNQFPGDGCGLFGGTIDTDKKNPHLWQMGVGFLFIMMLTKILALLFSRRRSLA